jgi:ubiquinone/menaquinone biosynthesis C-methylase UbiE
LIAETDPSGFDTIAGRPDYYIDFLDARTSIDDERRVKQVVVGLLQAQDGLEVLDVGTGTGDDARELAALVAAWPGGRR